MIIETDVLIIGAGFAGCILAHKLSDLKINNILVDKKKEYPDLFRAEKVEPEQARLLRKMGVFNFLIPKPTPVGKIKFYCNGKLSENDASKQYGFRYNHTVNNLRKHLPDSTELIIDKIISASVDFYGHRLITLENGKIIRCKLLIIATGGHTSLLKIFNLARVYDKSLKSLSIGFDISKKDKQNFDFKGFNCYDVGEKNKIDYLTAFSIGDNFMRVNVFTQWDNDDQGVKLFRANTMQALQENFPDLKELIGEFEIKGKVQVYPTKFYRLKNIYQRGLLVIGDEFQSVSPTTGTGLSKITVEVDLLTEKYITKWLSKKNISSLDIWKFYHSNAKVKVDHISKDSWRYYRNMWDDKYKALLWRLYEKISDIYIKYLL